MPLVEDPRDWPWSRVLASAAMSIELESPGPRPTVYEQYRALSSAAVASLIVGLLSPLAILDWTLVALPVIGVAVGALCAWPWSSGARDELTGDGLARPAFVLSLAFAVLGPARLTYVYVTEVPEGYDRVSYCRAAARSTTQTGQVVPPSALALEGKKIFHQGLRLSGHAEERNSRVPAGSRPGRLLLWRQSEDSPTAFTCSSKIRCG